MAAQGYIQQCSICNEDVMGDMQVHLLLKCTASTTGTTVDHIDDDDVKYAGDDKSSNTVCVRFIFKPMTSLTFKTITLLSAFNSIELTLDAGGNYMSEYHYVSPGDYDGQLILGDSYCYPLKKFMIDQNGETVPLELDPKKMESDQTSYNSSYVDDSGRSDYTIDDRSVSIQYNPAYQLTSHVDDGSNHTCPIHGKSCTKKQVYAVMYFKPNDDGYIDGGRTDEYMVSGRMEGRGKGSEVSRKQRIESQTPPTSDEEETTPIKSKVHSNPHINRDELGFVLSDVKVSERVLHEENRRLKDDLVRLSAQWEGRVKRLEEKLKHQRTVGDNESNDDRLSELEEIVEELRREMGDKDNELDKKEREIVESKDRITALENQIVEYASMINDQLKVIQNVHHHSHYGSEIYQKAIEHTKKQQIEFQEKLGSLEEKIIKITQFNKESDSLHVILDQLKNEVEEYRIQTKRFVIDLEMKDNEIRRLRERLEDGKGGNEFDSLEVANLKEKCQAWRERADQLTDQVDEMRSLISVLAKEKLAAEENLAHHLNMSSGEMTSKQQKLEEAMKQTKELQDIRVKMEADLYELRSEKTQILEHNALLVESCDPEKYSKLKKEMVSLQRKLSEREEEIVKLNESLQFHQERNVEFKDQLEAALNEDTLQQIQEKISKYKKERDNCKEQMKQMKVENEEKLRHISHLHELTVASLMKELEGKEDDLVKLIKKVDEYKAKKLKYQEMVKQLLQERELRKAPQDVIDDTTSLTEPIMIPPLSIANPNPSSSLSLMSLDSKVKKKNSKSVATDGMTNEVLVRTSSGALQLRIRKQQDYNVEIGTDVVIKRSGGVYELGTLRYIGTSKGENTLCGVELHIPRADDSSGKDNDGTYRNGNRYFVCDKGHGLYTTLNNVYNIIT